MANYFLVRDGDMKVKFGGGMEFLQTIEEEEKDLLWIWENSRDRKKFERGLEAEDPKLFKHFRGTVLKNI